MTEGIGMSQNELSDLIGKHREEIWKKLKSGETEDSIPIGGSSFTQSEWKKLLAKVDEDLEETKEEQQKRLEKLKKDAEAKSFYQKESASPSFWGTNVHTGEKSGDIREGLERKDERAILGITMIPNDTGTVMYGMKAEYAEDSTKENPVIKITVNKGGGLKESYDIAIKDIDPGNASYMEMFALCSYADDVGQGTGGTFGSWQKLKNYADNASMNGYSQEVSTEEEFRNIRQDWAEIIRKMMKDYEEAGIMEQFRDGEKLMGMLMHIATLV